MKREVGGDAYIDDAPHNVESLRKAGYDCIVMDAAYNRDVEGPRANSWADVERFVTEKMAWQAADPLKCV
jgi:5'(3')-deoxyribonucleotidase